jgi:hypothetical protein
LPACYRAVLENPHRSTDAGFAVTSRTMSHRLTVSMLNEARQVN